MEIQRPDDGERVIVLIPFGMRVEDDTYTEEYGWLNHHEYISHWQPINPPGTYQEIMQRPKGNLGDISHKKLIDPPDWFPKAISEHMKLMECITRTQLAIRFS